MASDADNTIDHAADTARDAINKTADAAKDTADDLGPVVTETVQRARIFVENGLDKLRTAYHDNPARLLTIGAVSLAGLIAILATLARRN